MKKHLLAGLALAGALLSAPASATVALGDSITCGGFNLGCSAGGASVGNGVEFAIEYDVIGAILTADFSAGLLTIADAGNPAIGGDFKLDGPFTLFFSNLSTPFTFAGLGTVDGVEDFDASRVALDGAGDLYIDLSNVTFLSNGSFQVNFNAPVTPPTGAVPEPATWAMMILGFGVVGGALRRRKTATVRRALA